MEPIKWSLREVLVPSQVNEVGVDREVHDGAALGGARGLLVLDEQLARHGPGSSAHFAVAEEDAGRLLVVGEVDRGRGGHVDRAVAARRRRVATGVLLLATHLLWTARRALKCAPLYLVWA